MTTQNLMSVLEKLEAAAKEATPGPWASYNGYQGFGLIEGISKQHKVDVVVDDGTYDNQFTGVQKKCDAQYIALANPSEVLRLVQALRLACEALEDIQCSGKTVSTKTPSDFLVEIIELNASVSSEVLASIQQLGLGEGGK